MRQRFYVGLRRISRREVFKSDTLPTMKTHGHLYAAVIGPFQTKRGAAFMARYGANNPHLQTVGDAERFAKKEADTEQTQVSACKR
jgi:hypothetical protein